MTELHAENPIHPSKMGLLTYSDLRNLFQMPGSFFGCMSYTTPERYVGDEKLV